VRSSPSTSPTKCAAATGKPERTSTRACMWRWAARAIWPPTGRTNPRAVSLRCTGGFGIWGTAGFQWGTTAVVARAVRQFGSGELADEVLPGVLSGHVRLCLGYTEPEGGSDVAAGKTRATRDGDGWII